MSNIKVLDCTLREGGYVNSWNFGQNNISYIIGNLQNARLDYIECGFFSDIEYNENKSIFSKAEQLEPFISTHSETKYTLMINLGEYKIEKISFCKNPNIIFRIAFKKHQQKEALDFCRKLISKGYNIFLNPMHTQTYSENEFLNLITETNLIGPKGFTIVDTIGSMTEEDTSQYFNLVDKNLDEEISICYHSHNNLQLSFANSKRLINICKNRELIIDSSLLGMGRGAGNLCTEIITKFLNDTKNTNYDTKIIYNIIDEKIKPIYEKSPWGYSLPYFLSAKNGCHPNYAKFLCNKNLTANQIDIILKQIPEDKKTIYDRNLIEECCFKM